MNEKSCLVTGAASGIGKATALLPARSGGRVTAADIDGPGSENCVRNWPPKASASPS
ncbi:hypothetical protein ACFY0N_18735 [Streptomyces vinaceus]|uniref:hypothetical protein n=1 Tax=Streptomyces vinaceus TaxID=1960 RepID=UPI0036B0D731